MTAVIDRHADVIGRQVEKPRPSPAGMATLRKPEGTFIGNLQKASDLENNVKISARRFEDSPFIERTNRPQMIRGVYAGRYFPIFMGEDWVEKYWALRQKALIFDVLEKPVEIAGTDAVPFLEKCCPARSPP